ncbi:hypothetical protein BTVI_36402 [Pitangus sulphuratus]|nr:hypothetical protein BTVI_36402 [Pitangus sulphuratus]
MKMLLSPLPMWCLCHLQSVECLLGNWLGARRGDSDGLARSRDQDRPPRWCVHLHCGGKQVRAFHNQVKYGSILQNWGSTVGLLFPMEEQHSWDAPSGCELLLNFPLPCLRPEENSPCPAGAKCISGKVGYSQYNPSREGSLPSNCIPSSPSCSFLKIQDMPFSRVSCVLQFGYTGCFDTCHAHVFGATNILTNIQSSFSKENEVSSGLVLLLSVGYERRERNLL